MTFINWSDSEEIVGLLIEYVADERHTCTRDAARRTFLSRLLSHLSDLEDSFNDLSLDAQIEKLRTVYQSVNSEFADDAVVSHLGACIEELEGIREKTRSDRHAAH